MWTWRCSKVSAIVTADTEDTQSDLQAEAENADAEVAGADDEAAGPLDGEVVEGGAIFLDAEMHEEDPDWSGSE